MYLNFDPSDISDFIKSNVSFKKAPYPEIRICCPMCEDTKKYKLYVNVESQVWCCHVCGYGMHQKDIVEFMSDISGQSYDEVASQFGALTPSNTETYMDVLNKALNNKELPPIESENGLIKPEVPDYSKVHSKGIIAYLNSRGLDSKLIRKYGIVETDYIYGFYDKFVLFKFVDFNNNPAFQGRRISKNEPKYVSSKNTTNALYPIKPFNLSLGIVSKRVWLVEGVFDAIGLIESGECALCCFGNKLSHQQLLFLKQAFSDDTEFVFGFDADKKTREKVEILIRDVVPYLKTVSVADTSYRTEDTRGVDKIDFGDVLEHKEKLSEWLQNVIGNRKFVGTPEFTRWLIETRFSQ